MTLLVEESNKSRAIINFIFKRSMFLAYSGGFVPNLISVKENQSFIYFCLEENWLEKMLPRMRPFLVYSMKSTSKKNDAKRKFSLFTQSKLTIRTHPHSDMWTCLTNLTYLVTEKNWWEIWTWGFLTWEFDPAARFTCSLSKIWHVALWQTWAGRQNGKTMITNLL